MKAINKLTELMKENLDGFTRHDIDSDSYNRGFAYCLEEYLGHARRLAQEEAKENPSAPASLVEAIQAFIDDRESKFGVEDDEEIGQINARNFLRDDFAELLSRYRPAPSSDEGLRAWKEKISAKLYDIYADGCGCDCCEQVEKELSKIIRSLK